MDSIAYSTTENLIVIHISEAILDNKFFNDENALSVAIVDFFEVGKHPFFLIVSVSFVVSKILVFCYLLIKFESVHSNIRGGLNPQYDLCCQYKIYMDKYFVEYLETDFASVDIAIKV